ncbi:hypothetical protein [Vibrio owensii]|uniref:hypothetical protein n=1 Tax=Vibrio harveyi group TaxID=717610 RepID=UPI003CC67CA6
MKFIAQTILKIVGYGAITLAGTSSSVFLYQHALEALSKGEFIAGSLMATLVPVLLFILTLVYQRGVVVPMRQLSMLSDSEKKEYLSLVTAIAAKRNLTEKVPFVAACITAFSAIAIIPSDIISSMGAKVATLDLALSSLMIALLAMLSFHAMRMAIASLKYNLKLQHN